MLKHDCIALSFVDVGHSLAVDFAALEVGVWFGSDHRIRVS